MMARTRTIAGDSWQPMIGKRVIKDATYHRVSRHLLSARVNAGLLQRDAAAVGCSLGIRLPRLPR